MTIIEQNLINTAEGVQIECLHAGTQHSEALLFIPGLGANAEQFRKQIIHFSEHYHTMAVSLRSHGESTYPPNPTEDNFSFKQLAGDVRRVLETQGVATAHVVGNSLGGGSFI